MQMKIPEYALERVSVMAYWRLSRAEVLQARLRALKQIGKQLSSGLRRRMSDRLLRTRPPAVETGVYKAPWVKRVITGPIAVQVKVQFLARVFDESFECVASVGVSRLSWSSSITCCRPCLAFPGVARGREVVRRVLWDMQSS